MSEKTKPEVEKAKLKLILTKFATDSFREEFGVENVFQEEPNFPPVSWPGGEHTLSRDIVLAVQDEHEREVIVALTLFNQGKGNLSISLRVLDLNRDQFSEFREPGSDKVVDCLANAIFILRKEARANPQNRRMEELSVSKDTLGEKFYCPDHVDRIARLSEIFGVLESGKRQVVGKNEEVNFVSNRQ